MIRPVRVAIPRKDTDIAVELLDQNIDLPECTSAFANRDRTYAKLIT